MERIDTLYNIIISREGADVHPWHGYYARIAAALHIAAWVCPDDTHEVRDFLGNLNQLNDHKGDLEVYWIAPPTDRQKAAIEYGWEMVLEPNIRHYLGSFGNDHGEIPRSEVPAHVWLGMPELP